MDYLQQSFNVQFEYRVYFTESLFDQNNPVFHDFLEGRKTEGEKPRILFVADQHVVESHPDLLQQINSYFKYFTAASLAPEIVVIPGGEIAKNELGHFNRIVDAVNAHGIDRHSYLAAIGGGSLLDVAGYAAAVSHRGIRHIRIPTTVLSQNDSGVGVKNGINYYGKKNFLGSFAPPVAVFNDYTFLTTLTDRDWRSGISEAVKVALIKDAAFFEWLERHADELVDRDGNAMSYLIKRCAELHMQHIASGDPFEFGSSRPLDFGHWSAHKLEQLTNFSVTHGEAVAIGIALDSRYSTLSGLLPAQDCVRIIDLLTRLRFTVTHPMLDLQQEDSRILMGLEEFQQHLGGQLTIMLLAGIGKGKEVHEMDKELLRKAEGSLQFPVSSF
jgi:3-dehydroquinate synthase